MAVGIQTEKNANHRLHGLSSKNWVMEIFFFSLHSEETYNIHNVIIKFINSG
jgi:hypothetical protein